jgi:hypothetical protein
MNYKLGPESVEENLSEEEIDHIYSNIDPGFIDNLQKGVYWTPYPDMSCDFSLMSYRWGHIVDVCAGIGGLAKSMFIRDSYDKHIESMTPLRRICLPIR